MGAKKRLLRDTRRALDAAERALADQARVIATTGTQLANARTDRDRVHEHLAEAGFLRVDGLRTVEDRLQAAEMGVLVLDDVQILDSEIRADEPSDFVRMGAALRTVQRPLRYSLKLEISDRRPDLPGEAVSSNAPAALTVTPTHQATLEQWHGALAKAIRDQAVGAVPGILVRMARDGWGHEAEEARRQMIAAASGAREALDALGQPRR